MKRNIFNFQLSIINLAALMLLFVGCDKIEPGENGDYTIFAGSTASWTDGTPVATPVQCAYVEKYTGPKCSNCPSADITLEAAHEQYGDQLVLVSINHPTGQGVPFSGEPDLRTDDGNAWDTYFGINAIPAAYINRNTATQYQGAMSNIIGDIGTALQATPTVAIEVSATRSAKIDISVNLQFLEAYSAPVTLTLAITEDGLAYKQLMPDGTRQDDYVHNHMLRDVITDVWGVDIDCTGNAGECRAATFSYNPTNGDINLENCHIVAFVSDKASRVVLNSASCIIEN